MKKLEYVTPELEVIKLAHYSALLEGSGTIVDISDEPGDPKEPLD